MGFKELSPSDFTNDGKIKNGKQGLIFFSQSWCPYCVQAKPIFKKFANMSGQTGYLADGEKNKEVFQKLGIQGIPDIRRMDSNGNIGKKYEGERTPTNFKNFANGKSGGKKQKAGAGCGIPPLLKGGKKKKTRKHSGINQTTGKLKKGYKYSGKLKSGLSRIIKVTKVKKGGGLKFKQRGPTSEKLYNNCKNYGCKSQQMPYCCPSSTKSPGYCRKHHSDCDKTGMKISKRKRDLTKFELNVLRNNMNKNIKKFEKKQKKVDALSFLDKMLKEDKIKKEKTRMMTFLRPKRKSKNLGSLGSLRSFRTNNFTPIRSKPIKIPKRK